MAERYGLREQINPWGRCPRCNGLVEPVDKAAVAGLLPPHTRQSYSAFRRCIPCGQIYWKGAHHKRIQAMIDEVRDLHNEV